MRLIRPCLVFAGLLAFSVSTYCADVIVRTAPPTASVVVVGRAPSPKYLWVGGYYRWTGSHYVLVAGRWMMPPRTGAIWIAPRWVPRSGGYVFVAGRWK